VRKPTPPGQHIRLKRRFVRFRDGTSKARKMLKPSTIGIRDYVLEGKQRIGRIRFGHRTHALRLALAMLPSI
jgi:hypothetical protein